MLTNLDAVCLVQNMFTLVLVDDYMLLVLETFLTYFVIVGIQSVCSNSQKRKKDTCFYFDTLYIPPNDDGMYLLKSDQCKFWLKHKQRNPLRQTALDLVLLI